MKPLSFEWDEANRVENLAKHGIDFNRAGGFGWNTAFYQIRRLPYGEDRLVAYGAIEGRLHVLVYTLRNGNRRIVSLRKANRREQAEYAAAVLAGLAEGRT